MKKHLLATILISITAVSIICSICLAFYQTKASGLISNLMDKKIRILIVPGHEPKDGGADYKGIYERNLNFQLSDVLANDLSQNKNIEVTVARDTSDWNPVIKNYVINSSSTIMKWVSIMKAKMVAQVNAGQIKLLNSGMIHNDASSNAVLFLFGINKWADENKMDIVLNVHFNNNPKINGKPNYRGYTIYIPEKQYGNASTSKILANDISNEISKIEKPSNMPQEKGTITEDQELIAIGAYNTLKAPVAVVEYAYIYEPIMASSGTRNIFMEKAASSTATAINNFIETNLKK